MLIAAISALIASNIRLLIQNGIWQSIIASVEDRFQVFNCIKQVLRTQPTGQIKDCRMVFIWRAVDIRRHARDRSALAEQDRADQFHKI